MYEKLGVLAIYWWKRLQKRHLPSLRLCTTQAKCAGVSGWSKAQTNVIGALCGTVPFAFTAFDCSIDSDVFHTWADRNTAAGTTRVQCDPDGHAPFRKRQDTLDALQAEGHTGCCGSQPYSPDFNPIEKTWHGPSSWGKNGGWLMWIPCCFGSLLSLLFDYKEHFPLFHFATHRIVIHK